MFKKTYFAVIPLMALIFLSSSFLLLVPEQIRAQSESESKTIDRIVAIVNDHLILKSEVDSEVLNFMQQSEMEFSNDLWYRALNSVIENYIMLEKAKLDSINISDSRVDQAMDQRIDQLVQRAGSEKELERSLGKSLIQIKAEFRDRFREDMIVQRVRKQKAQDISITRPEVVDYFERIPNDSLPTIPERVGVSQIVAIPPPEKDARDAALSMAKSLRDSVLNHGKSIEELARRHSDGPSASSGGELGMIPLNQLVPEYSAAASALDKGEISQVVETTYGFHVIRLNDRISDKISTNHILIEVDANQLDDQVAIDKLNAIRDSVMNQGKEFSEMARKHSEDQATAQLGGKLINPQSGERLIPINELDPSLYRISLILEEEGDISEPKPFTLKNQSEKRAFRIVRLDRRIPEHTANIKQDYDMVKRVALQQKQRREVQEWLTNLLEEVYLEYKVPIPTQYKIDQS